MKTIKMFQTAMLVLLVSVLAGLAGCSDQITSSGQNDVSENNLVQENKVPVFDATIVLKPNRSYTFNGTNTPFNIFNSVYVENTVVKDDNVCNDISIFGSGIKLDCNSSGFNSRTITIQNNSTKLLKLNVTLSGSRVIKKTEVD